MKKRFNIFGSTSKGQVLSGKKAQFNKYWYVFIPLVLFCVLFLGYGVFGDDGGSSGYFVDSDRLGGWEYFDGGKVYTAYTETNDLGGGKRGLMIYSGPEFVKEDDELKTKKEARSLKGYYKHKRLVDDGIHDIEYIDWNYTSITFTTKVKDAKELNKDIPIKRGGVQVGTARLTSVDTESEEITISADAVMSQNISFGQASTTDLFTSESPNSTFKDNRFLEQAQNLNRNYGTNTIFSLLANPSYVRFSAVFIDLEGLIGTQTITDARLELYVTASDTSPALNVQYSNLLTNWTQGNGSNPGNSSPASPCTAGDGACGPTTGYKHPDDGTALWSEAWLAEGRQMKNGTLGSILNLSTNDVQPVGWLNVSFDTSAVQEWIDGDNFGFMMNLSSSDQAYSDYSSSESGTNNWKFYVEYTTPNTSPYIEPIGNITIAPWPTAQWTEDITCKFNATDEDAGDTLTAYVDWYKDNVIEIQNNMSVDITTNTTFTLDSGNTSLGQRWNCSVRAYDGTEYSPWVNSSETEITSAAANKTDFTTGLGNIQSNKLKDVYVYDASKESWNRTADIILDSWYKATTRTSFPDKVYLLLTDTGLDIVDASDTDQSWMDFVGGSGNAINGNDFTSVYALDGKIYVGSDLGLYVLDFANDNISRYDNSNGLATFDHQTPFHDDFRNNGLESYFQLDGSKALASNIVNDVHVNRVRGEYLVAVATDGDANGVVNIINLNDLDDVDDDTVAELDFVNYNVANEKYSADSIFLANDGTLYYSENRLQTNKGNTKLSFKYSIDTYTGTGEVADGYYLSRGSGGRSASYPHFLSEFINDVYVASGASRAHLLHNILYVATESGVSVIQEIQSHEGSGTSKNYGYTSSANSDIDYKVLDGVTDNVTAVTARSDGNEMYVGNNDGSSGGWVSKISLSSNTLVDYWNSTSDPSIVGEDITGLDFLDGDLLVGTLSSGATQLVEEELDHYLVTDYENHRVVEIDNTGLIHWEFGVYGTPGDNGTYLTNPTYAERHDDGNYLIADSGNRRILEVDSDGAVIQQISNITQLSDATSFGEVYSVQKIS